MKQLITNVEIVNEGKREIKHLLICDDVISAILPPDTPVLPTADVHVDGRGKMLLPGAIDDQVHFREPGLTQKADIASESAAAVAGGVTSFMEMPNTIPQTTTLETLASKYERGAQSSLANYSFYIGATNDNLDVVTAVDYSKVCGIKLFMGSSTGNMLVDNEATLSALFEAAPAIITAHCEDETTIRANLVAYKQRYADNVPWECHAQIRSAEACYKSSAKAATLARKYGARLHILHLSTADELSLLDDGPLSMRKITGEACVHHLWFSDADYATKAQWIKWNPSIKAAAHRDALRQAVRNGLIAVVATDHAPHTIAEKTGGNYFNTPSGAPMVQHSLIAMLEMAQMGLWSYETVVDQMCHRPAQLFGVSKRGFIREGYKADLVLIEKTTWQVQRSNVLYKCGWSPMEGVEFHHRVCQTYVNGHLVYNNDKIDTSVRGERLLFNR